MTELLIIDDDEDIRFIVKMILERTGSYRVHEAATGAAGKSQLHAIHPDLLLLDYLLPDIKGLDLLQQMKNEALLDNTRVLILTARMDPDLESEFIKLGARGILHKPFDPGEFLTTLESYIESV